MPLICWAAKGGSGTTFVAVALARCEPQPALVVDLAGDVTTMLGLAPSAAPGALEWLASRAAVERLDELVVSTDAGLAVLPAGQPGAPAASVAAPERLAELASWCTEQESELARPVVIDAGLGPPPRPLTVGGTSILVTRACYLALRAAVTALRPAGADIGAAHGIVFVDEPGRSTGAADIERAIGAPIVASVPWEPAVQRAIDAGVLMTRVPPRVSRRLQPFVRAAAAHLAAGTTSTLSLGDAFDSGEPSTAARSHR